MTDVIHMSEDMFAKVPGTASTKGVALNKPPASILAEATRMVTEAMANVPPGEKGQLVAIATMKDGKVDVNLAFAVKVGKHVDVVQWIGLTWGEPVSAGLLGRVHF